jgi:hypothetical protein
MVSVKISKLSLAGIVLLVALASVGVASANEGWGCTPGFWKNHPESWPVRTSPEQLFGKMDLDDDGDLDTYMDVLGYKGGPGVDGAMRILYRTSVAAHLNQRGFGRDFTCSDDWVALYTEANMSGDRATIIANANLIDECNNSICAKEHIRNRIPV